MKDTWFMGVASDKGMRKKQNEDSFLHLTTQDGKGAEIALFVVADGMGGYDLGEVASRHAINEIKSWWEKRIHKLVKRKSPLEKMMKEGEKLVQRINSSLLQLAENRRKKMGTTLSLLILYQGSYVVIHIGDSRIYLLQNWNRAGNFHAALTKHQHEISKQETRLLLEEPELLKITEDHSWVAEQIDRGILDEEAARNHPKRNVLTQCLGIQKNVTPFLDQGMYEANDLFLVCSDGFYSLYSNEEIKHMLLGLEKEYGNLQAVSDYLINFSNFEEAYDNVTLMLIRHDYVRREAQTEWNGFLSFLKGRLS
jgi:serine/threonine protein phosphatase PrpC